MPTRCCSQTAASLRVMSSTITGASPTTWSRTSRVGRWRSTAFPTASKAGGSSRNRLPTTSPTGSRPWSSRVSGAARCGTSCATMPRRSCTWPTRPCWCCTGCSSPRPRRASRSRSSSTSIHRPTTRERCGMRRGSYATCWTRYVSRRTRSRQARRESTSTSRSTGPTASTPCVGSRAISPGRWCDGTRTG
jgi:hypothetical protein